MSGAASRFDARLYSVKLRQIATELRRAGPEPAAHLAQRLEAHAEAMLRPEGGPGYRPFALRAERLSAA